MPKRLVILTVLALALTTGAAGAAQIEGDYIEARTADVFTGPCFSNSEVFITGNQAVLAWKIRAGQWGGQDLTGLTVAAAIRGNTTFSQDRLDQAEAVVIVDQQATESQRSALIDLAKHLAGDRLQNIREVKTSRMSLTVENENHLSKSSSDKHFGHSMPRAPMASFWAAGLAEIATRPLDDGDHVCGNEDVAYEPLSKAVRVVPAYTLGHRFRGESLKSTWSDPNCRSSFVGHFAY